MNLDYFHFIRPYWFITLLPLVMFIMLSVRKKLARGNWSDICDSALMPFILQENNTRAQSHWSIITVSLASMLAIIALAGPTWERLPTPAFRNDAALVIALDLSRSMDATDIKPSRLIRARYKIADIIKQRKDGLTALLVYAGDAFTVTPLTTDTGTIISQLNALKTSIMPSQGNNTLVALQQAVNLLQQAGQQQGNILLISDAVDSNIAKQVNHILGDYHLSVLGVGTIEGAPVKLNTGGFLKDSHGNIVVPKLTVSELASIANNGHGIYKTISVDDSDINAFMASLDKPAVQKPTAKSDRLIERWDDKGPWVLLLILPLAALYFRKGLLVLPLVVLLNFPQDSYAFAWQDLWQTQEQQAQQAFNQQHYQQAAQKFQSPQWKASAEYKAGQYSESVNSLKQANTADEFYNLGNGFAKLGQLQQAIDAYKQALKLNPDHQDASYNKKLVEQALRKQQSAKSDKQSGEDKSQQDKQEGEQKEKSSQSQQSSDKKQNNDRANGKQSDQNQQNTSEQKADTSDEQEQQNKQVDNAAGQQQGKLEQENRKQTPSDTQDEMEQAKDKNSLTGQTQAAQQKQQDEVEQAYEQWLNRIPDDPSGLLKRKFKYQYQQRNQNSQREQQW